MQSRTTLIVVGLILVTIVGIIIATLFLTPAETNPANAAALAFADAAARGDDTTAASFLSEGLRAYVDANCPNGSVSACVDNYIPDEWGPVQRIVYRRGAPDGDGYNIDLIGTWEKGQGFSGVCIYVNVQPNDDGSWRVERWAGFAWCGEPGTRDMATNPDAINRAP